MAAARQGQQPASPGLCTRPPELHSFGRSAGAMEGQPAQKSGTWPADVTTIASERAGCPKAPSLDILGNIEQVNLGNILGNIEQ
eukprot:486980-Pelagomonas_calceolata.AAC.1